MYFYAMKNLNDVLFVAGAQNRRTSAGLALELFEQHQGTHILQVIYIHILTFFHSPHKFSV